MNSFLAGVLLGTGVGVGMLVCPQIRHFVDKVENKIKSKKKMAQEKADE